MKHIRILLLSCAAIVPLGVAADAADPIEEQPIVEPTPTSDDLGVYFRGDFGWSALEWNGGEDDTGWMIGGGIGYQISDYLRSDLTVDWSGNYDVGARDIAATTVMGNVYFDLANDTAFTPYVGAGLGYGFVSKNPDGVALGLAAGVAVDLSENIAVDVGYRFRDIMSKGSDPKEHMLTAGMRFSF